MHNSARDENPQVRRAVAGNLRHLILLIPKYPDTEAVALFQQFAKDDHDMVRMHCVDMFLALSQMIPYAVKKPARARRKAGATFWPS